MPGYVGNILVIYDIRNPATPEEVSRWWLPGQHIAGGEKPTWPGTPAPPASRAARRRPAVGGLLARRRARDRRVGYPQAAHDRRVQLPSAVSRAFAHVHGRADPHRRHAASRSQSTRRITRTAPRRWSAAADGRMRCLWVFDVTDLANIKPLVDLRSERARFAVEPRGARHASARISSRST